MSDGAFSLSDRAALVTGSGGIGAVTARFLAAIPLGRFAEPEEVAAAVGFLASDEACDVTSEVLLVHEGRA
jgi:NAD(P)-dependent dehydrogenase (short-subunit alcohol dehydrogenase family)